MVIPLSAAKAGAVLTAALLLSGCSEPPVGARAGAVSTLTATRGACTWRGGVLPRGRQRLLVRNRSAGAVSVALTDPASGDLYAQVSVLAPGTERVVVVALPAGRYRWTCTGLDTTAARRSTALTSRGPGRTRATAPVHVLTLAQTSALVAAYRAAVQARLGPLISATDALDAAADAAARSSGSAAALARAQQAWLPAHLDYARLGAAYGTFADLDDAVNGLPPGGAGVPASGFLRVEHDLWAAPAAAADTPSGADAGLATDTDALDQAVRSLAQEFPQDPTEPSTLTRAAHEVLEVAAQRELSGRSDEGSHSALATVRADVDATTMVLDALAPALTRFDPSLLVRSRAAVAALAQQLDALRRPDGTWPPVASLTTAQHEDLDAATGAALEVLALVPGALPLPPSVGEL